MAASAEQPTDTAGIEVASEPAWTGSELETHRPWWARTAEVQADGSLLYEFQLHFPVWDSNTAANKPVRGHIRRVHRLDHNGEPQRIGATTVSWDGEVVAEGQIHEPMCVLGQVVARTPPPRQSLLPDVEPGGVRYATVDLHLRGTELEIPADVDWREYLGGLLEFELHEACDRLEERDVLWLTPNQGGEQ